MHDVTSIFDLFHNFFECKFFRKDRKCNKVRMELFNKCNLPLAMLPCSKLHS